MMKIQCKLCKTFVRSEIQIPGFKCKPCLKNLSSKDLKCCLCGLNKGLMMATSNEN